MRDTPKSATKDWQTAVFAGGCFWGVEGVFERAEWRLDVVSGYAGGSKATASYEIVSTGTTGHAESVKITYDPSQDHLRPAAEDLLLHRARPDGAESAGAGRRPAISLVDLLRQRRAEAGRDGVHRAAD